MSTFKEQARVAARLGMWDAVHRVVAKARNSPDRSLSEDEIHALDRVANAGLELDRAVGYANALGLALENTQ